MRAFNRITGASIETPENRSHSQPLLSAGPTMIRIEGPEEDIEEMVRIMDEGNAEGRRRNKLLEREHHAGPGLNSKGEPVLYGRRCCYKLARKIDQELHRLKLPVRRICPGCGTTWGIETRTREERPHVWTR